MDSQQSSSELKLLSAEFITHIQQLYSKFEKLESLEPRDQDKQANSLYHQLVDVCRRPRYMPIDIENFPHHAKMMREQFLQVCARQEGVAEMEFSKRLLREADHEQSSDERVINKISTYPHYEAYRRLEALEHKILKENGVSNPRKVAFIGSGPLPLSFLVLATEHMRTTSFDLFDIDQEANDVAEKIISSNLELKSRVSFFTQDILTVGGSLLQNYDCIFLAALVGTKRGEKVKVIDHLHKYMKPGSVLLLRSVKGGLSFLYPAVRESYLQRFQILTCFHPSGDSPGHSIFLVRKPLDFGFFTVSIDPSTKTLY